MFGGRAAPGLMPTSPKIVVGPVLVTDWPARTPKLVSVPRGGGACAWLGEVRAAPIRPSAATAPRTPANFAGNVRIHVGSNENPLIRHFPMTSRSTSKYFLNPTRITLSISKHPPATLAMLPVREPWGNRGLRDHSRRLMKNLFYGFCAAPRFYTTKTQSGRGVMSDFSLR